MYRRLTFPLASSHSHPRLRPRWHAGPRSARPAVLTPLPPPVPTAPPAPAADRAAGARGGDLVLRRGRPWPPRGLDDVRTMESCVSSSRPSSTTSACSTARACGRCWPRCAARGSMPCGCTSTGVLFAMGGRAGLYREPGRPVYVAAVREAAAVCHSAAGAVHFRRGTGGRVSALADCKAGAAGAAPTAPAAVLRKP